MKNLKNYISRIALFTVATACTYEFPETPLVEPTSGTADFSKMIVLGDGIAAGFMDGALYNRGQRNSFAVQLAEQMKAINGGEFTIPDINSENGFFGFGPNNIPLGRLILRTSNGTTAPAPIGSGELPAPFTGDKTVLNNFSVPNLTLGLALIPQTGGPNVPQNLAYNPLYARFASNPGTSTPLGDAAAALANGGTFFTLWLGSSDVLGYAISGASNPSILTAEEEFTGRFTAILGTLLQASPEAKGAVANIPNLNVLPYFNLVPWNALPLDEQTATFVNSNFAQYNGGLVQLEAMGAISAEERALRTIEFQAGLNGFLITDEALTDLTQFGLPSIRQSNSSDKATLTLSQALGQPVNDNPQAIRGVSFPVEDSFVLTPSEQTQIQNSIEAFNSIINVAVQNNSDRLVLVDVNDLLDRVLAGQVNAGGQALTASIVPPNGGFSVDGIHPNGRAHAFVTNEFIQAINAKWGSTIPLLNPNSVVGNDLPIQ
ncbi:hypothetical protein [Algoriphagus sp.]|uniref:hypothetical protein n=1 Tax=Algoriphagus sp. TaxID=1872435 RepID=UPI00260C8827|nr:hypothetical protein [Algoriphagus sp.]